MRHGTGRTLFLVVDRLLLAVICLLILVPLWMVVMTSLSSDAEAVTQGYVLVPHSLSLKYYAAIVRGGYMRAFLRSIAVTVVGTVVSIAMTLPTGYVLAQKDLAGRDWILRLIVFTMLFEGGIIPFYMVVRGLGLINRYAALVIPLAISTYNLILVKNYMASVPSSLVDSGRIDGCSEIGILARIILPVSVPIVAAVSLFYAVSYWNLYFEVVMFINTASKYTLQVLLRQLVFESESITQGTMGVYNNFKMTVMVMAMLPILALYPYIQRHFVTGLMLGSIKG